MIEEANEDVTNQETTNSIIPNNNEGNYAQKTNDDTIKEEIVISDDYFGSGNKEGSSKIILPTFSEIKPIQKPTVEITGKAITTKTLHNKELNLEDFYKKSRHYFIITDAGKPVYSRYGDEIQNCGIFGMISAMVTKFTTFVTDEGENVTLHYMANENNVIVLNQKGHLYYVALSKKNDSVFFLNSQLEYLHLQLLSILTKDRVERLEENPSHCNTAMSNTETLFEQMIIYTSRSMVSVLNSYPVLPFESRAKIMSICDHNRGEALACLIITKYAIIGLSKPNYANLLPSDIILIQNMLFSSESLRKSEAWVPLCLPGLTDEDYMQMYCNFTEEEIGIIFITEKTDPQIFMAFVEQCNNINERMLKENLIEKILQSNSQTSSHEIDSEISDEKLIDDFIAKLESNKAAYSIISNNANSPDKLIRSKTISNPKEPTIKTNTPNKTLHPTITLNPSDTKIDPFHNVIYGICKHQTMNQFFTINFNTMQALTKEQKSVYMEYIVLLDMYNSLVEDKTNTQHQMNNFFHYEQGNEYTNVIQTSETFIFLGSFNFFYDYEKVNSILKEIFKYLKLNESTCFVLAK